VTLRADAVQVVDMRLRQIAAGNGTPQEMFLMVSEKIDAAAEARTIMLRGGDCNQLSTTTGKSCWLMCSDWTA